LSWNDLSFFSLVKISKKLLLHFKSVFSVFIGF
jgi:hypothetical protein